MKFRFLPPFRSRCSESTRRSRWFHQSAALLALGTLPLLSFSAQAANQQDVYTGGAGQSTTSLLTAGSWSQNIVPTSAYDAILGPTYPTSATATLQYSSTTGTFGSLNDVNQFSALTISNAGGTSGVLTLGGGSSTGNSFAPSTADLLFVGVGANLTIAAGSGTTLGLALGAFGNFDIAGTAAISSVISGTGFSLTKTGAGTLTLSGANTFGGGVNLNAGTLSIAALNNLGTGNLTFNGGTLAITAAIDPSARFTTTALQTYNINNSAAVTFATALTSSGGSLIKSGTSTLTSTAANTYSGATTINGGSIALSGAGSLASTTINIQSAPAGSGLLLTNTGVGNNVVNRVADTATINLNGGSFVLGGSDQLATAVAETVGSFTIGPAVSNVQSVITVSPGSNATPGATVLAAGSLTRAAGSGMALINGVGLGSSATSNSRFLVTTAPTLVGAGTPAATGNPGAGVQLNTGIVTGLVGESATTTGTGVGTVTGAANTFLTYTATGGYRPLNPTDEFTNNAITAGNNNRITLATSMTASTAVNSLVIGGATAAANTLTLSSATTLTVSSGMLLFAPSVNVTSTITGGTVAFGANEGQIYAGGTTGSNQTIASAVIGSNGLTVAGPGNVLISGNVTLTGGTLVNAGHFLTLNGADNLTGASVVTSAGNGGILFAGSLTAFNGASSVTAINGSQIRYNGGTQGTFSNVPITLGDANTSGNIYLARGGDNADLTYPGQITIASPTPAVIQAFNAGSNSYILSGGINGTGAGGLELQGNGNNATYYDRITLGGTLSYAGPTYLSNDSNLRVAVNATTLPTTTVLTFRAGTASRTAQFDLNGTNQNIAGLQSLGALGVAQVINSSATAASLTVNNTANYTFVGNLGTVGAVNAGGTVTNATGGSTTTVILAAGTSNNFSLVKSGTGMLQLTGANSYTGTTTVNGGTLIFGSTGGAPTTPTISSGTGAITVNNSGSTLGGTGSLAGAVTINTGANITGGGLGVVGALTLAGTIGTTQLTLATGSTYLVDIGVGAVSDTLKITGTLISNNATIQINSGTLDGTSTYTIATYSADTGSTFTLSGASGYSLVDSGFALTLVPVPEPSTYVGGLLTLGVLGWSQRRRFTRRSA